MKRIALCTAAILLIISLAGCGATPQNTESQNERAGEAAGLSSDAVKASGSSSNDQSSSYTRKEKLYAPYEEFGMHYDADKDELTYHGKWFVGLKISIPSMTKKWPD